MVYHAQLNVPMTLHITLLSNTDHVTGVTGAALNDIEAYTLSPGSNTPTTFNPATWVEVSPTLSPGLYTTTITPTDPGDYLFYFRSATPQSDWCQLVVSADNSYVLIRRLANMYEGRWLINTETAQLTVYDTNNTTPLQTWNLKDSLGNPAISNPYERIPTLPIP